MRKLLLPIMLVFILTGTRSFAQEGTITGTVTSAQDEETIPGVTVRVKDTNRGTITGIMGNYEIEVMPGDSVLVFSFVGMQTLEVPINNRSVIDVTMSPAIESLEEVVVVGYGTESKKLLTGSVGSVNASQFKEQPTPTIDEALQGRTTGIQIVQNSGTPGGGFSSELA